jgi:cell division protein FtsB|tara:strand:+ start:310 stop:666 length:357 start_codon:yes stop_codon:yes gene_type:complete
MRRINKSKKTPVTLRYRQKTAETKKRILRGVALLVGITLVIIFFFGDHGIYQLVKINSERERTQKLIAELRLELQDLEDEKNNLKYNDDYLMRLAREKYGMVMPGEKMFKVIEKKPEE